MDHGDPADFELFKSSLVFGIEVDEIRMLIHFNIIPKQGSKVVNMVNHDGLIVFLPVAYLFELKLENLVFIGWNIVEDRAEVVHGQGAHGSETGDCQQ